VQAEILMTRINRMLYEDRNEINPLKYID